MLLQVRKVMLKSSFLILLLLVFLVASTVTPAHATSHRDVTYDDVREGAITDDVLWQWWTFESEDSSFLGLEVKVERLSGDLDTFLWILDEDKNVLFRNDDWGGTTNSFLSVLLENDGIYYVVVGRSGSNNGRGGDTAGRYQISFEPAVKIESGGTAVTTFVYLSPAEDGNISGFEFHDEDIVRYNLDTDQYSLFFDGSDVGLGGEDVNLDALAMLDDPDDGFFFSLNSRHKLPGIDLVDDSDVIRFIPTQIGPSTIGSFSLFLDGSMVGLREDPEDIDAISFSEENGVLWLVVSTLGRFNAQGVRGEDEDLLLFNAGSYGKDNTQGTWKLYFDGSAAGLATNSGEDVKGVHVANYTHWLTTLGDYRVSEKQAGDGSDIFGCRALGLNSRTACWYSSEPLFDGFDSGFGPYGIDAFSIITSD